MLTRHVRVALPTAIAASEPTTAVATPLAPALPTTALSTNTTTLARATTAVDAHTLPSTVAAGATITTATLSAT